jgi:uncharacterized phiE125 gp8 family phage protein
MPNEQVKHYSISVVTPPASEPVSKAEAWLHLRVDDPTVIADEDSLITDLIQAAREHVEMWTRRTFMPATFDMFMDAFPNPFDTRNPFVFFKERPFRILLPRSPFKTLTWLKYYDLNNDLQTLVSGTDFQIDTSNDPARIDPIFDTVWPVTYPRYQAVNICFQAGYADATSVPACAKIAMKQLIGDMYAVREQSGSPKVDNKTYDRLLSGITLWEF